MNLDLKKYSTFNIGGTAHAVFEINQISDIEKINSYCKIHNKPLVIIGEGSNSIFAETIDKYVIGLMKIKGVQIMSQEDSSVYVKANAGELWDDLVAWCVDKKLSGLEALSGIPGTVGAAPIQNIGAYGSDVSKTFIEADVFDKRENKIKKFSKDECYFGYRESIFKKEKDKYIIISITLKLSTLPAQIPQYKDIQDFFSSHSNSQCRHSREDGDLVCNLCTTIVPSIKEIRDAILTIRNNKIPDYKKIPNCGSFFKNPVINKNHLESIQKNFPTIPFFELPNGMYKVFAGWLIEHVEYQKAQTGKIIFNETNKLVLLNNGNGTFDDLQNTLSKITKLVQEAYTITLEIEPNIFS